MARLDQYMVRRESPLVDQSSGCRVVFEMTDSLLAAALRRRVSIRWPAGDRQVTVTFQNSVDAETFVREVERGEVVNHSEIWQEESDG
jgi:hypothetical protein